MDKTRLISGRSNLELAEGISKKLGIPLTKCKLSEFANTEIQVEILENIRNMHVYLIQSGSADDTRSINDYIMELLALINACKLSNTKSITVIIPYYPYSRSDKKDAPRTPIMGALIGNLLKMVGVTRIVSMDLHAGQIQGFTDLPFDNLYALCLHVDNLKNGLFKDLTLDEINSKYILASPDGGGVKRVEAYAKRLQMDYVVMHKQRDYSQKSIVLRCMLIGDPEAIKGKTVILIDDMCDTCGTIVSAANELKGHGARDVIILATHGLFSSPAFERLNDCEMISKVVVTNTLPQISSLTKTSKLEIVDTSNLFAEVIERLVNGGSISALFLPCTL